jgi:hypothetical protein
LGRWAADADVAAPAAAAGDRFDPRHRRHACGAGCKAASGECAFGTSAAASAERACKASNTSGAGAEGARAAIGAEAASACGARTVEREAAR